MANLNGNGPNEEGPMTGRKRNSEQCGSHSGQRNYGRCGNNFGQRKQRNNFNGRGMGSNLEERIISLSQELEDLKASLK